MEKQGYLITRTMVYGTETPQIPDGWEDTGEFRPGHAEEIILSVPMLGAHLVDSVMFANEPRIILRKKRVRKIIFTQVAERRVPQKGEWLLGPLGWMEQAQQDFSSNSYPIFTREEVFE